MKKAVFVFGYIALIAVVYCREESQEDKLEQTVAIFQFTDLGLADLYEDITKIRRKVLLHEAKYTDEVKSIAKYGSYARNESMYYLKIPADDINDDYRRNYSLLIKPGDFALNTTELYQLISFSKSNDHLSRDFTIPYPGTNRTIDKQAFLNLLATSRNLSLLQHVWSSWYNSSHNNISYKYEQILSLVNEAALRNELYDPKTYWEALVEVNDGYQHAENLWRDIEPTYKKLHEFVLARINNYYNTNYTEIPVYLTGSRFGEDWSSLADIVVPHQQMYKDAEFAFEEKSMIDIYKIADITGQKLGFEPLDKKFFSKKNFKQEHCTPTLLTYTYSKYSEVFTCNNVSWNSFLEAHEVVIEAGLKGMEYLTLPRREFRQSFLEEAIVSLGPIVAIQNVPNYGFTPECDYINLGNVTEHRLAARLLLALRILPKIAYYLAADFWRLEELQNPSENIEQTWWEKRKKYQGVQGVLNEESDFLSDLYIISNKPYLAKFFGNILLFHLLNQYQLTPFAHNDDLAEQLKEEYSFKKVLQDIPLGSSVDVFSWNYGIYDFDSIVTSIALTEFFQPLEDYFNNVPLIPHPTLPRVRKVKLFETTTNPAFITTTSKPATSDIEVPPIQNDQDVPATVQPDTKNIVPETAPTVPASGHSAGMYVLITVGACFFILVATLVFKKLVTMRRPRTNNRRFET